MTVMLITKGAVTYGLVSGGLVCPACKHRFAWDETRRTPIGEEHETMRLFGPGCPHPACGIALPLKVMPLPVEDCGQVAQAAAHQHNPLAGRKAAVAGVWGQRAGLLAAFSFPSGMKDATCGERIDEFLVSEGWPERYGATWIRAAVWGESKERGGQDHERIMVHYDGHHLAWSPVCDWIVVAPPGLLDD